MRYEPHDYQRRAIAFLLLHPNTVLLLDMGLGKTVITLTALQGLHTNHLTHRALVIAPKRVAHTTWPDEITKWDHLAGLQATVLAGGPARRATLADTPTPVHIVNRELVPWLVQHHGQSWPYDTVVIDELSSFKNPSAKRNKALARVRGHINRMIGLTGTPTPNGLMDLFGQYKLIDSTIFGTRLTAFRERYFEPTKYVYGRPVDWAPRNGTPEVLYDAIRPVTLSMTAEDYLELPDAFYVNHPVTLPKTARDAYQEFKRHLITELGQHTITAGSAAELSGRLRQFASGAVYTQSGVWEVVHEAKLDALEDLIEAANGHPMLVAYWYQHEATRILERFPYAKKLDTATDFHDWNQGGVRLGLIHPASSGFGLNLQAGGHLVTWYSLPWSVEHYQQLNARLHRQGQTHPVTVTHLLAGGTIDARIHESLTRKETTQDALIDAVKAELATN